MNSKVTLINKENKLSPTQIIAQHGTLNNFLTDNKFIPADIAGDLGHSKCLKNLIEYFYYERAEDINLAFEANFKDQSKVPSRRTKTREMNFSEKAT